MLDSPTGVLGYAPQYGNFVYFELFGSFSDGTPVYFESVPVPIGPITPNMAQKLPESLTRIESEAFAGTALLLAVEIPASVTYIDDHAFLNSNIQLIVGHHDYTQQFAVAHEIDYMEK